MQIKPRSPIFVKAQLSSVFATAFDFIVTHALTGLLGLWYLLSSPIGTILGGLLNFLLGRYWVFQNKKSDKVKQAMRYILIWCGSLLLNTCGIYLLTEKFHLHYLMSKLLISITVSIFFNYYFQKTFVFKVNNEIIKS